MEYGKAGPHDLPGMHPCELFRLRHRMTEFGAEIAFFAIFVINPVTTSFAKKAGPAGLAFGYRGSRHGDQS